MTNTLNLRARFPDGQTLTLTFEGTTSFKTLLKRLQTVKGWTCDPRVLISGPPPRPLTALPLKPLKDLLTTGESLLVEPQGNDVPQVSVGSSSSGRGRGQVRGRGRGRGRGRRRTIGNSNNNNVKTLSDLRSTGGRGKRCVVEAKDDDSDDERDITWNAAAAIDVDADDEDENEETIENGTRKRQMTAHARGRGNYNNSIKNNNNNGASSSAQAVTVDSIVPTSATSNAFARAAEDSIDMSAIALEAGMNVATGHLSVMLARSVFNPSFQSDNKVTRELRANFSNALKKRQTEAEGERRLSAYLSKRYEIKSSGPLKFHVRYRAVEDRTWTEENKGQPLMIWPKVLLKAVVKEVLNNPEDKMKLRSIDMAAVSPRMFWNLVRIFGNDDEQGEGDGMGIEKGLRKLVPDADWSFLDVRTRTLSAKAKRNLEMGFKAT